MNKELLEKTLEYVKERFKEDFSGHDYYHTLRVYKLAASICNEEKADLEIVQLAALLHDVDDYKLFGKNEGKITNAELFLRENNVSEEKINAINDIIASISFKGTDTKVPETIEGKIVQDADRIDAIGAIGIARAFAYGGSRNRSMYDPDEKPRDHMDFEEYSKNKGTTINHFYEKLLKLKDMMNTESGRRVAENRHKYMEDFLNEFYHEWEGRI